ncbi:MAG: hypothetical protein Q9181_006053 [Wetmoreana brouardii]
MKALKESKLAKEAQPCYHVPYAVNPRFWGRNDALEATRQALNAEKREQAAVVLRSLGYGVVLEKGRLRYENAIRTSQNFRDIARHTGLVQSDEASEDAMAGLNDKGEGLAA